VSKQLDFIGLAPQCCPPLSEQSLTADTAGRLAPRFKALGDPVRLRLLSMIASQAEVCVCDLTGAFGRDRPLTAAGRAPGRQDRRPAAVNQRPGCAAR
jgi:hypothetical protein